LWELSILVLNLKIPQIIPVKSDFSLSTISITQKKDTSKDIASSRINDNLEYTQFKSIAKQQYQKELELQNSLDLVLYKYSIELLCDDMHTFKLWENYPIIRKYWKEKSPLMTDRCQ